MNLLELFKTDSETVPKTLGYKLKNKFVTLEKQEEALTKPQWAYRFARDIPGADIRKCEEAACKDPCWAYYFARSVPGANIRKCEEAACKDPNFAYQFARDIPGADIKKCEETAYKNPACAYWFARDVPGANIKVKRLRARILIMHICLLVMFLEQI